MALFALFLLTADAIKGIISTCILTIRGHCIWKSMLYLLT